MKHEFCHIVIPRYLSLHKFCRPLIRILVGFISRLSLTHTFRWLLFQGFGCLHLTLYFLPATYPRVLPATYLWKPWLLTLKVICSLLQGVLQFIRLQSETVNSTYVTCPVQFHCAVHSSTRPTGCELKVRRIFFITYQPLSYLPRCCHCIVRTIRVILIWISLARLDQAPGSNKCCALAQFHLPCNGNWES